jgi:hypothetical protein
MPWTGSRSRVDIHGRLAVRLSRLYHSHSLSALIVMAPQHQNKRVQPGHGRHPPPRNNNHARQSSSNHTNRDLEKGRHPSSTSRHNDRDREKEEDGRIDEDGILKPDEEVTSEKMYVKQKAEARVFLKQGKLTVSGPLRIDGMRVKANPADG